MTKYSALAALLFLVPMGHPAFGQSGQPAGHLGSPQPSAGGTPERTPFDIPYGTPISADQARVVLEAAGAEAKKRGWPTSVAVVDTHGELVAFLRPDGAPLASGQAAQRKASTSARWRRETRVFFNSYVSGASYVGTFDPGLMAAPGGYPLVAAGRIIGAVGCGGGTGDQDALICQAGAEGVR